MKVNKVDAMPSDEEVEQEDGSPQAEGDGDSDSIHSVFRGALDVQVLEIPWESDIKRRVDFQRDENDWETRIRAVDGGVRLDGWESRIVKMSKEADKLDPDIWKTSVHELPSSADLHSEWGTEIAGKMTNNENPVDWSTKFNTIEKTDENKNSWSTVFLKLQNRVSSTDQWTTRFNSIGSEGTISQGKPAWTFKLPQKMTNLSLKADWSTKINSTSGSVGEGTWKYKFSEMLLQCDDRKTNWNTKFLDIRKNEEITDPWDTSFKDITSVDLDNADTWNTTFYGISEERDLPGHWNTRFTNIDHPSKNTDWSIKIEDIPDNLRQPADWSAGLNSIENLQSNELWDTLFNGITRDDTSETQWTTEFVEADITDITREGWESNLNAIDRPEIEWEVNVNQIIIHPTNHPIDQG